MFNLRCLLCQLLGGGVNVGGYAKPTKSRHGEGGCKAANSGNPEKKEPPPAAIMCGSPRQSFAEMSLSAPASAHSFLAMTVEREANNYIIRTAMQNFSRHCEESAESGRRGNPLTTERQRLTTLVIARKVRQHLTRQSRKERRLRRL